MGSPMPITTPPGRGTNEPLGITCSSPCRDMGTTGTLGSTAMWAKPFLKPEAPVPRVPEGKISTDQPLPTRSLRNWRDSRLEPPERTNGTVPRASAAGAPLTAEREQYGAGARAPHPPPADAAAEGGQADGGVEVALVVGHEPRRPLQLAQVAPADDGGGRDELGRGG